MEIAILPQVSLRIKGKQTTLGVDPKDKTSFHASLLLSSIPQEAKALEEAVILSGTGEYEIGGVKMTGTRSGTDVVYSLNIDGIDILIGKINALDSLQHKVKEHNIVIVQCDEVKPASFLTSLAVNTLIFYGVHAKEVNHSAGRENTQTVAKYSVTKDKLPQEMETVILE